MLLPDLLIFSSFLSDFACLKTISFQRGKVPGSSMGRPTTGIAAVSEMN